MVRVNAKSNLQLFALNDECIVKIREVVGSKIKAMIFANRAARVLEVEKILEVEVEKSLEVEKSRENDKEMVFWMD